MEMPETWSEEERREIREALLAFFDRVRRPLPWRETSDPYAIWVSEVMSQQTRIETVVPYYRAWMAQFPTPEALAAASEEEVLRLWQGLGYYSRARNLHRAARQVVEELGGRLPDTAEGLRELPGVGPYTAGAVASIALGEAVPAVDGNVRRVLSRLLDDPRPGARRLEAAAGELVDPEQPGAFNQALMELGSLVCTPRSPDCPRCPVSRLCRARARGTQEDRPAPRKRRPVPHLVEAVAVLRRSADGAVLLRRRPTEGLLGGMWECPGTEVARDTEPEPSPEQIRDGIDELLRSLGPGAPLPSPDDLPLAEGTLLPAVDHVFSHRKVTYRGLLLEVGVGGGAETGWAEPTPFRWVLPGELDRVPLPVAQQALLARAGVLPLAHRDGAP